MTATLGSGEHVYEEIADWAQLPDGWDFHEVVDVVVDSQDRVSIFNRGEHPLMVFEPDGRFVRAWGEGLFTRPHGLTLARDERHGEILYCVDDDGHWIGKFSLDGQLLMSIGRRGEAAPRGSGQPFNRPTKVALDPRSGELYISGGYGNARVHKYSADGRHLFSWGDFGVERGQFNLPHSVCTDRQGRVYVADRENHRIQIFDDQGNYLEQWNNLHRPCGLHIAGDTVYIGQLPTHLDVNADYPNLGACVTIHDLSGRCLARLGDSHPGERAGQFTAPHGIAVDSRGDIYVGEVSWSAYGSRLAPPRTMRSFRKLVKQGGSRP
jgi:DNA-binding beta-propeller fold protein YncE